MVNNIDVHCHEGAHLWFSVVLLPLYLIPFCFGVPLGLWYAMHKHRKVSPLADGGRRDHRGTDARQL